MHIEVYSTNISRKQDAARILKSFKSQFPDSSLFFDLEDCDRIMKVVASIDIITLIPDWLRNLGFECAVLPD